jgi:hypothetical protein
MCSILSSRLGTLDVGTHCCICGTLIIPNFYHLHFVIRSVSLPSLCPSVQEFRSAALADRRGLRFGISTLHLWLSPRSLTPLVRSFALRMYTLRICDSLLGTTYRRRRLRSSAMHLSWILLLLLLDVASVRYLVLFVFPPFFLSVCLSAPMCTISAPICALPTHPSRICGHSIRVGSCSGLHALVTALVRSLAPVSALVSAVPVCAHSCAPQLSARVRSSLRSCESEKSNLWELTLTLMARLRLGEPNFT